MKVKEKSIASARLRNIIHWVLSTSMIYADSERRQISKRENHNLKHLTFKCENNKYKVIFTSDKDCNKYVNW